MRVLFPSFTRYAGQIAEQVRMQEAFEEEGMQAIFWPVKGEMPKAEGICWQAASGYHQHLAAFGRVVECGLPSVNAAELVRWNSDKRYMRELEGKGIASLPTFWAERCEPEMLRAEAAKRGWDEVVVKPVVSAGAFHTHRIAGNWQDLRDVPPELAVMMQPFAPEILEQGEVSLLFLGGAFSYAVVKRAKAGDYRIQHAHGGSYEAFVPEDALVEQAEKVLAALPEPTHYARVDGILRGGELVLMEVELIEPYLFLDSEEGAAARFARAVREGLGG